MEKNKDYNIGLDIGVGSIGWCVTDKDSNIIKRSGRNMWGSTIFNEAQTASNRRNFRSSKRRLRRRKERINILQSLMQDDMDNEFPNFFQILKETSNISEDKVISKSIQGIKYNLFSEIDMNDKDYYEKFPTIYHLRKYLINTNEKVDLRLVYLAIHHIIKYRGNFLYDGEFSNNTNEVSEKIDIILKFLKENYDITLRKDKTNIFETLTKKGISKSAKKEEIISFFDYDKSDKQVITNVVNSFVGSLFDLNKIFDKEISKSKISFSVDIENEETIVQELGEEIYIYYSMQTIYSWYILQDILSGKTYISEAFVEKYNKYSEDLKLLKKVYKEKFPNEYNKMFKKVGENNYVSYNGKNAGKTCKKCKPEEFFQALKKKIDELSDDYYEKREIEEDILNDNFLRKINVTDNGAIPHQLHKKELEIILNNQSKYYKTLKENKENILLLFSFRIPYYIGPLAKEKGNWSWIVRKNSGRIRPWNFDKIVDEEATAEEFIKRMTNKCTYILNEDVMPKQSLLYSRFCVLNELNNIRIDGNHIPKDTKQKIIDKLFKKYKKVTENMIKELLRHEGFDVKTITGLSDGSNFNSNMASYIDMEKIFGKIDDTNFEQCEKLIYWITIFEDKKILKRKIKNEYKNLTEKQINDIVKLKYSGWSRLSKKLIAGIKSNDNETIMEKLEKTSLNFMQIINLKEFGFDKKLEKLMPQVSKKITYKDIEEIPTSPANKRAIWKAMCVVKEIVKVMKEEPKNIYIEFARQEEKDKKLKDNRAKQLLKKYEDIEKQIKYLKDYDNNVYKELKKHQSDKMLTDKMYLYFIQCGKCLYSGKALNIDELERYEIDHIIPQSYIKDDSIDNKALVIREENQRKKDSLLLSEAIINNRIKWWESLLSSGLITQNKFYKLTRRKLFETNNDREKFVERQLVETRQITKYVTNLLINQYKDTQVFAIKSSLTHIFRHKYKIYKNRNVNNYHHAQDAYIMNIIGNLLNEEWGRKEEFKYSEYVKKYLSDEKSAKEKYGIIMGLISKYIDIAKVKKVMEYKDCYISRMLEENTGEFYNQTLYSPNDKKNKPVIPLKDNRDPRKYGGYSGEDKAYYVIYQFTNCKNKKEYKLIGIPIQVAYKIKDKKQNLEEYIKDIDLKDKQYTDFKILRSKILKNQQYLDENGEPMRFCSDTEIRTDKELIVNEKMNELIYLMNLDENKLNDEEREKLQDSYIYMFNYLMEKLEKEYKVHKSIYLKLLDKKDKFIELTSEDKKSVINGMVSLMETGQGSLKALGLGDREGRKTGQTFKTEKLLKITFIDKSVTGMYERRYKVDGMENSSNK